MKLNKIWSVTLLAAITLVLSISIWADELRKFEFGKYDDFEEALDKGLAYEMNELIYKTSHNGVTIVMYTTTPNPEDFLNANFEAVSVRYFEGNDEEGWVGIGHEGWEHHENDHLTLYNNYLREYEDDGSERHVFNVRFGEIHNPEIVKVETKSSEEESFSDATIIQHGPYRYYFHIGEDSIVQGLSSDGEVIDRQGG